MDKKYYSNIYERDVTATELADRQEYLRENGERERGRFSPYSCPPKVARRGAIAGQSPAIPRSSHQDWPWPTMNDFEESRREVRQSDHFDFRPQPPQDYTANVYNRNAPLQSPGEPGSASFSDPLRKGMSGAATKWYKRFLLEGKSPAVARELALSRKVGPAQAPKFPLPPGAAPGNREMSRETSPRHEPKRARRLDSPGPSSGRSTPRTPASNTRNPRAVPKPLDKEKDTVKAIQVGVVHEDFPHTQLSKETMEELEDAIAGKIILGWRSLIRLEGIHFQAGHFIVSCCDQDTVEWLEKVALEVGEELSIPLRTLKGVELPKDQKISVWLPKAHLMTEETTLATIEGSNPVDTKSWKVIKCATAGPGRILVAKINSGEQAKLASQRLKLFFRFKRLDVHGLKGSVSPEAKQGKDEANGEEEGKGENGSSATGGEK